MRSTRPPQDRKFGCPKCEKKFFTPKDLRRHENTHLGLREHVCPSCHTRFGRKDHLTRHAKKSCSAKRAATGQQLQVALQHQAVANTGPRATSTTATTTTATSIGRTASQHSVSISATNGQNHNNNTNSQPQPPHLQPQAQPEPQTQPQTQPQPQLQASNHHLQQQQQHHHHLNQHHYHQVNGFYCENQTDETLCLYCDKTICNCALVASQNGGRVHQMIGGEFNYCQSTIVNEPTYQQQQLYEYYI